MRAPICFALVLCAFLSAACGEVKSRDQLTGPSPASPTAVPGGSLPDHRLPVQISSGADGSPVAGARVVINDDEYHSGPIGQVEFDPYSGATVGDKVDVDAPGFLPRRTRLTSTRLITLWPVADEAEAEAVREMVYRRGGTEDQVLKPPYPASPFYVSLLSGVTPETETIWRATAEDFGAAFNMPYEVTTMFQYDPNETGVFLGGAPKCVPIGGWGFCRVLDSPYEDYQVQEDKAQDPATIRRVLAYRFLGANPLPGLMSLRSPADQLSAFEVQTIRMILQRPLPNQWPDTDR